MFRYILLLNKSTNLMMNSIRLISQFSAQLLFLLLIAAIAQHILYWFVYEEVYLNALILSYIFNFILTVTTVFVIFCLIQSYTSILGYVFLLSSLLKFLCFFLFLAPQLSNTYDHRASVVLLFFIPYIVSLTMEIRTLIKALNRL